jgi:hypothetical protein
MTNKDSKMGMFISDIPSEVYFRFKRPCVERCGDTYWVRLKELLDKEEAYDLMLEKENGN